MMENQVEMGLRVFEGTSASTSTIVFVKAFGNIGHGITIKEEQYVIKVKGEIELNGDLNEEMILTGVMLPYLGSFLKSYRLIELEERFLANDLLINLVFHVFKICFVKDRDEPLIMIVVLRHVDTIGINIPIFFPRLLFAFMLSQHPTILSAIDVVDPEPKTMP
ncbi:uncharacterized protein E5676_scaffold98G00350 [Cucumis melo var. makuwa]|uniref:Uncharacterized protein n=1 Tax=Cucumis melo var. makuwa TaxID=1194695 RepID=A0A5D3C304_CUCMM|nr:uncharacterized protein E6C27_scaffold262G001010 [Cucumis melo var. makuwa]TYK05588.1 uncharacterized protein E5676_scaffold98G00350 [Cucumis melo var. makuwa]